MTVFKIMILISGVHCVICILLYSYLNERPVLTLGNPKAFQLAVKNCEVLHRSNRRDVSYTILELLLLYITVRDRNCGI